MEKKLGNFNLIAEPGEVSKGEAVGVLGENGIGKTTFVKLLAGVIKPDKGSPDTKVKVSYKPQYIDSTSNELVMNIMKDAIKKYDNEIIVPLTIKPLLTKQINQLSGGELQRVAIALSLSKDCNLVLLDEPSAYLDVEQRLKVSKVIKHIIEQRNISAIIVDHDLLFLDYLSDRLLVFEGTPAKHGLVKGPFSMEQGMNSLLTLLNLTLRRDGTSHRPRINKINSVKDREQKSAGKLYYS
jgi:ATP-binding cassette subfamily E protein 1